MSAYHQILVPFDGSPTSEKALDEAIRLARLTGARLRLLHVVDELSYVNGFETAMNYTNEIVPLMQAAGEKLLALGRQKAVDQGVDTDSVLIVGGPGRICEHVAEQARSAGADLIVVGSHGRRGMGRVLMGSDAEQIVRTAPVPVLVVRGAEDTARP
ncbi:MULTISPECIES: universal stress protein [unclassified Polaromonas]|uniref:universal stress protein n=1 Tax=unclassified Polaromonas TaxID=2638319 RepID=UPI000BCC9C40|nr:MULTISPECIES: universal stress protein [unclassified Polaromonas]OYY38008.1 MAG: universal stress protein UspA [Polaromonas sp. 35-63-35]OYZ18451.1 MAG: universal stress protein UspA [Polaromonas sp. 16-63-31]OYZ79555.1 MAG: universal stress protein UspA [Polaromonas sp. 24-63-21]OZA50703.1 MAG: universal stress protein UspA [Polaromonas sp. 17-63-33]OZA89560.1 MAG: universal stress protein UspA [Polaromonas sp. 39-63-25]